MGRIALAVAIAMCAYSLPAHASISAQRTGVLFGFDVGSGNGGLPFAGGVGWHAGLGLWVGKYDDDMALGRHWAFTASVRQDWLPGDLTLRSAGMLEIRRGFDLVVVGFSGFVSAGPLLHTVSTTEVIGGAARVGGNVKWRFHAHWGLNLRVDAGVDVYTTGPTVQVGGALGATLGLEFTDLFAKPARPAASDN